MDIVFHVRMTLYYEDIRAMILSITTRALRLNQGDVRIGVIKVRSQQDHFIVSTHGFDRNIDTIRGWLNFDQPDGGNRDGYEAVGDGLNDTLNIEWRLNNSYGEPIEKLLILITDAAPNGLFTPLTGQDPWVMSKELATKDVTLAVVGMGSAIECDDFYSALAQNTGGAYIPVVNAQKILDFVIEFVISEETTLTQAFRRVSHEDIIEKDILFDYSFMKNRVDEMMKICKTMNDVRLWFFKRRSDIQ